MRAVQQSGDPVFLADSRPLPNAIWLESLSLSRISQGWFTPQKGRSCEGKPITLNGVIYPHGVGTHAISEMLVDLNGSAIEFLAVAGIDDETNGAGCGVFQVWVDGRKRADSGLMRGGDPARVVRVNLTGAKRMALIVGDGGRGIHLGHADWAGAQIVLASPRARHPVCVPREVSRNDPAIAHTDLRALGIHGPRIVGAGPGRDFVFRICATGRPPLRFSAAPLPPGLSLDPGTGIISGRISRPGTYRAMTRVENRSGSVQRELTIVCGKGKLALTPPMGWNSWNVWATTIDDAKIRAAARRLVDTGLASFGYHYVNIDDGWQGKRDARGVLHPGAGFPDMKDLAGYVHSRGLRVGIYSSPGPHTCAGYLGSYRHEETDAATWAAWGMDYLKHDWCSYQKLMKFRPKTVTEHQRPYRAMREALDKTGRDIVYSLCQYGLAHVSRWGAKAGGNCWRTTGDLFDTWGSLSAIGFGQNGLEKHARPGRWNDPDMLVVGWIGWCKNPRPTRLTRPEQITHLTLWSLLAAPLLIGCDLNRLDRFTFDLLTNGEVLDVNQDPLGRQGWRVSQEEPCEVWARPLHDGSWAVGLFNRGWERRTVTVRFRDLDISGARMVRDLWKKRDLGRFRRSFSAPVPPHGAVMVRITGAD